MNVENVYRLSLVTKELSCASVPELQIHLQNNKSVSFWEKLVQELHSSPFTETAFAVPKEMKTGDICGYQGCGYLAQKGTETHLSFPLYDFNVACVMRTMHVMLPALYYTFLHFAKDHTVSDAQYVTLYLNDRYNISKPTPAGFVFPILIESLKKIALSERGKVRESMVRHIDDAMQEVWQEIAPVTHKHLKKKCSAGISRSGLFSLMCPTDAEITSDRNVDMQKGGVPQGVYPTLLNSYNIHTAYEHLTLIAGLARMLDLVRTHEEVPVYVV